MAPIFRELNPCHSCAISSHESHGTRGGLGEGPGGKGSERTQICINETCDNVAKSKVRGKKAPKICINEACDNAAKSKVRGKKGPKICINETCDNVAK